MCQRNSARSSPTALVLAAMCFGQVATADVTLPAIIGSNMVMQRSTDAALWGWAAPGERIRISASWGEVDALATVTAGRDGTWRTHIATPAAGGPHTITITGDNTITLENVLIGEVWVCSGQSNMEWPLARADNAQSEISSADHPGIRLFMVPNTISLHARTDCGGAWVVCSPETARSFSAVGYFFGRELNGELGVPIGLISADWGGTRAEAWTSEPTVRTMPDFADALALIEQARDPSQRMSLIKQAQDGWWSRLDRVGDASPGKGWTTRDLDDSSWRAISLPATLAGDGLEVFDGLIYFRTVIELPDGLAGQPATLGLGPIDDFDDTWVNGEHVGATHEEGMWNVPRTYDIPAGVLRSGANVIAVRVLDTGGIAGINGKPEQMVLRVGGRDIALAGQWRLHVGNPHASLPPLPRGPRLHQNLPTVLYNGMIAPLIPCTIRGAIWYQGESNRMQAVQYRSLFPAMIRNWREDWGLGDFPFYFVQIAPFRYGGDAGQAAMLREAQFMTLAMPNTGMVVTTDIGNPTNIHPTNKQEVGRRLALWALANDYGRDGLECSGPLYDSMEIDGREIRLRFTHADRLVARDGPLTHFTIAGPDRKFVPATARIVGGAIVVSSNEVADPVAVRFGWRADAEPNLFNSAGLPASTFRTGDWGG